MRAAQLLRLMPTWVWLAIALAVGAGYANWRIESLKTDRAELQQSVATATARIDSLKIAVGLQADLLSEQATIETTYQAGLQSAHTEIDRMQRCIDDGACRMRVAATYVPKRNAAPSTAAGQPDGGTCELDAPARSAYFGLRRGLDQQRLQIVGLQAELLALHSKCRIGGTISGTN